MRRAAALAPEENTTPVKGSGFRRVATPALPYTSYRGRERTVEPSRPLPGSGFGAANLTLQQSRRTEFVEGAAEAGMHPGRALHEHVAHTHAPHSMFQINQFQPRGTLHLHHGENLAARSGPSARRRVTSSPCPPSGLSARDQSQHRHHEKSGRGQHENERPHVPVRAGFGGRHFFLVSFFRTAPARSGRVRRVRS